MINTALAFAAAGVLRPGECGVGPHKVLASRADLPRVWFFVVYPRVDEPAFEGVVSHLRDGHDT